jgi:phospholipid transport system transporter-binding protein
MIAGDNGRYSVQGSITMANAKALLEQGAGLLSGHDAVVDFGQVEEVDSSAIGLMLAWLRSAAEQKRTLRFSHLPENLKTLAALYGVLDLIPQDES